MPTSPRVQARLGALLLWVGLVVSLGLTLVTTFAWGFAKSELRSHETEGLFDEELAPLAALVDSLAHASLWVALGAVPLGLLSIISGLVLRGRANRHTRCASKPQAGTFLKP